MVLDKQSRRLIEYVMPLSEFYDESVTGTDVNRESSRGVTNSRTDVQMIENVRDPNTSFEAVYFLTARPEIIACLLYDFRPGKELYAAANLLFLNAADDALLSKIGKIGDHVRNLRELYLDFVPNESRVFTTDSRDAPVIFYNPSCGQAVERLIRETAMKIVCVCIMLGEYPMIRYHKATDAQHAARSLAAKLANTVQAELDNHARNNEAFPPKTERPRGVLIITDRSLDLHAPVVHEFTFQAMANDLLPIRDGCFYEFYVDSGKGREKVQEVISEKDAAWISVRHMHMSLAIDKLVQDFNKFTKDNAAFGDQEQATNLNTIRNMLAGMDSYASGKDKYSLYINMAQECMSLFEKVNLPATGQIEQDCSTGVTSVGKTPKGVLEAMIPLLDDDSVPIQDRLRMLMTYVLYKNGIFPDDCTKLFKHAKIPSNMQDAVRNLDLLGVPPSKDARNKRAKRDRRSTPATVDEAFELSRFCPTIKKVIEQHLEGTLDQELYPYTRDVPPEPELRNTANQGSLRTNRPAWAKGRIQQDLPRQRIIAFVAGGATYSEVRSVYELSESLQRDVILGTTNLLTPSAWIEQLSQLRRERKELNLSIDAPQAPIPLLEQKAPPQQQQPQQVPSPAKKSRPFSGASKEEQRNSRDSGRVEQVVEKEEKTKKKFGLFGKKK